LTGSIFEDEFKWFYSGKPSRPSMPVLLLVGYQQRTDNDRIDRLHKPFGGGGISVKSV
jgi:hypothetical protein